VQQSRQIQEGKNKLSEVVEKKQTSLAEFFRQSPLAELDLERDRSSSISGRATNNKLR